MLSGPLRLSGSRLLVSPLSMKVSSVSMYVIEFNATQNAAHVERLGEPRYVAVLRRGGKRGE